MTSGFKKTFWCFLDEVFCFECRIEFLYTSSFVLNTAVFTPLNTFDVKNLAIDAHNRLYADINRKSFSDILDSRFDT